jgi:hypothetical protein
MIHSATLYYRLAGHEPVAEPDLLRWSRWFEEAGNARRIVARTDVGGRTVSTVFLGIDHNFCSVGPPLLFETMIFGLPDDEEYQERCTTWDEALAQHQRALEYLGGTDAAHEEIEES